MRSIIRNGKYLFVDKIQKGDIKVPKRPSNLHSWNNEAKLWEIINIELFAKEKIEEINNSFIESVSSGVTVSVQSGDIKMDGTEYAGNKMKAGYDLAVLNEEPTMNIVDYNNEIHLDIPIDECLEIARQQGNFYRSLWTKRAALRKAVMDAETVQDVDEVVW